MLTDLPPVVIENDMGGPLRQYALRRQRYEDQGRLIVIDGPCGSGCTLLVTNYTCATDRASLHFHAARKPHGAVSTASTRMMMTLYPSRIRRWIEQRGGLSSSVLTLRPPDLFDYVRKCTTRPLRRVF